jgi:putative PIN family toxin of toxin-antitoxin system
MTTVVLDTNVLVQIFGRASSLYQLRDWLVRGELRIAVSTPVLMEYEEVICRMSGRSRWLDVERFLELIGGLYGTVRSVSPSFRFRTIIGDPDDDAFADCAIAAEADWIITSDHHFDALRGAGYKPQPIRPEEFIQRFLKS